MEEEIRKQEVDKFLNFLFSDKEVILLSLGGCGFGYTKDELLEYYYDGLNFRSLQNDMISADCPYEEFTKTKKKEKKKFRGMIYLIKVGEYYKIGRTINLDGRYKKYVTENPHKPELIHSYFNNDYVEEEKRLHTKFIDKNYNREWFSLSEEDILYIKGMADEMEY